MSKKSTKRKSATNPKTSQALRTGIWTKEVLKLLGTMSDQAVATRIGVTDSAVNVKRRILGILPFGKSTKENKHPWSKKELAILGKLTDAKIGRALGLTSGVVGAKRRSLGIPIAGGKTSRRRNWKKSEIEKLGTISDVAFSKQFGINRRQVKEKRQELGIPAFQSNPDIRPWDKAMIRDVSKLTISAFVKKYEITRMRVIAQRIRLGIMTRKPRSQWTAELERELLASSVQEFATKYGISAQAASVRQRKLLSAKKQ
jgi:hypothetical protein